MRILWLTGRNFTNNMRTAIQMYLRTKHCNIASQDVIFFSMHQKIKGMWTKKGKSKWGWDPSLISKFDEELEKMCTQLQITHIVINDEATLKYITRQHDSLHTTRGSTYYFKKIPATVFMPVENTHKMNHGKWYYALDCAKLSRWVNGRHRHEPKFNFTICDSRDSVDTMCEYLLNSLFFTIDIETSHRFITCIGYTGVSVDGSIRSFTLPFFNPTRPGNCHWRDEADEIYVHQRMRELHASSVYKVLQNGSYDNAYLVAYGAPPENYFFDTLHMFHAIWPEAPKKLNEIASVCMDFVRFWKDEGKGDRKDAHRSERVPLDRRSYLRYLRYNGLDTYYTALNFVFLVSLLCQDSLAWARENYNQEFRDQIVAFAMSMRGMLASESRQRFKTHQWMREYEVNLKKLRIMVDDSTFNPNSQPEYSSLIYDVLGVPPIKTKGKKKYTEKPVDEKVLTIAKTQHPIYDIYIQQVWDTKKPRNNISKYGTLSYDGRKWNGMELFAGRFLYNLWAAGTETSRYAGKEHQFWCGTNPQNIPEDVRDLVVADDGYILAEFDYAQSDAWFMAYTSEDENYIKNISDDRDTHCVHAEHFFKIAYEKLLQGHIEHADWVDHSTKGVRQNTKRIVHGANFLMQGFTLYMTMGHEACVEAAKMYGFENAGTWTRNKLVEFCEFMLVKYFELYPTLAEWQEEEPKRVAANGNLATTAFGRSRLFFGNVREDNATQRKLASFYGQGGTAGNINRSLRRIYFETSLEKDGLLLHTQTHDSILTQIREDKMHENIEKVLTIMEEPVTIKGREFSVPVECNVGYSWGKKCMLTYDKDLTIEKLREHESKWAKKYFADAFAA